MLREPQKGGKNLNDLDQNQNLGKGYGKKSGGKKGGGGKQWKGNQGAGITFCCFFSRRHHCRYGSRCHFRHGFFTPEEQRLVGSGMMRFECERVMSRGFCKHKARGEHC
jgi:hypothetical protein